MRTAHKYVRILPISFKVPLILPSPASGSTKNYLAMRNIHVWKTVTADREKREVRAERFGGRWRFQSKLQSDAVWTYYDTPSLEDLEELRDILWRKYQRKRLPHDDVASVDAMLKDMRPEGHASPEDDDE